MTKRLCPYTACCDTVLYAKTFYHLPASKKIENGIRYVLQVHNAKSGKRVARLQRRGKSIGVHYIGFHYTYRCVALSAGLNKGVKNYKGTRAALRPPPPAPPLPAVICPSALFIFYGVFFPFPLDLFELLVFFYPSVVVNSVIYVYSINLPLFITTTKSFKSSRYVLAQKVPFGKL